MRTLIWRPAAIVLFLVAVPSLAQEEKKASEAASLPPRSLRRYGTASLRHGSRIQCLEFAPKSGILIAGGGNDPIRLWDHETGQLQRTCNDAWVQALAWNPKARQFASGGAFRTLRLWNPYKTDEEAKFDPAPAALKAIAFSPDGKVVVAGCHDGQLIVYSSVSVRPAGSVQAHQGEVNAVAFAADGTTVATGGGDRLIRLWKMNANFHRLDPAGEIRTPGMIHALCFTPAGTLFSAGDDRVIRVWAPTERKQLHTLEGHQDTVSSLAIRSDGKQLVSAGYDETIRVWDLESRKEIRSIRRRFGDSDALALSHDGQWIATGGVNHTVRLFEAETGKERVWAPGPQAGLVRCVLSPDLGTLSCLTQTGEIHSWEAGSARQLKHWNVKATPRIQQDFHLAMHPRGEVLVSGSSTESVLELWNPSAGTSLGEVPLPAGEKLASLAFDPVGKVLAAGFRSGLTQLLDWPGKTLRLSLKASGPVTTLAFSAEAPIVAGAAGGVVHLWDLPTGQELRKIASREGGPDASLPAVSDLAFSPDGRTLAIAGHDAVVRLVDWTVGKHLHSCEGHASAASRVVFASDGRSFASASHDQTVRIWETFLGQSAATFSGHVGPVTDIVYDGRGRALFSASADTTSLAWDVTGLSSAGSLPEIALDSAALQAAWQDLASEDSIRGMQAIWRLVGGARDSVGFLSKQIYLIDPARIDQLFLDLNSDAFGKREKATQELEKYGRWMEGRLQTALTDPPNLEVRRRLERMVGILRATGAMTLKQERLRVHRVLSVLEQIGTPAARKVVEDLTKGAPEADLQHEAGLSLKRLDRYPSTP